MKRTVFLLLLAVFFVRSAGAQVPDSTLPQIDSLTVPDTIRVDTTITATLSDSISKRPSRTASWSDSSILPSNGKAFTWAVLKRHPYFGFGAVARIIGGDDLRHITGKEKLFYVVVILLLAFAFMRSLFPRYINDLFRLFFRTTIKQRQIREQLMQTPLPSLLMNVFFVLTGGLYIAFMVGHYNLNPFNNFWILVFYACTGLSVIYFIKFIGLKISGWLFNMSEAADSYIFIVFIVNKMIGMLLLPFIVFLAFSVPPARDIAMTISWCMLAGLLGYRFILTYLTVRNQVKVNPFHFFLYLLAFEIAPLLLVYKGLLLFFRQTA